MKPPIQIPPEVFRFLLLLLAAVSISVLGFMFVLALRGVAIPPEFGKTLIALGTVWGALILGPKPKGDDADESTDTPAGD